jgi:tRNA1(Val) A37 N6-methylase TrmN6
MNDLHLTQDDFLGGRLNLIQPKKGYRITSDSVYLAASISLKAGESILDMGAGNGGILSCLATRLGQDAKGCIMHGIEIQPELMTMDIKNAQINGHDEFTSYFEGDIFKEIEACAPNSYHHVVSNPPYFEKGKITASPHKTKALAFGEDMVDLKKWVERCLRMVRPKGTLTLIHRAERMDDIICALNGKAGSIVIFPFYPKQDKDASRIIIRAQKDAKGLLSLKSGLIVHKSNGDYTPAIENILRHAKYLDITK